MKTLKIVIAAGLVLLAVYYYIDNYVASNPLMGSWKSDKELSMKEYYAAGVTAEQEALLLETLGEKTIRITKDQWMSSRRNEDSIYTYYITAEENGCYTVKKTQLPPEQVCVHDDRLYVPGIVANASEVFVKH